MRRGAPDRRRGLGHLAGRLADGVWICVGAPGRAARSDSTSARSAASPRAEAIEHGGALARRGVGRGVEDLLDLAESLWAQRLSRRARAGGERRTTMAPGPGIGVPRGS